MNKQIIPNYLAILLAYLFYRNENEQVKQYWALRNQILDERFGALERAIQDLPVDRNPYGVVVIKPEGSMYPHLKIKKLPPGLSLDWLSSQLARYGVGLVPLSAFTHTSQGFDEARQSFRLTLGGGEAANVLYRKMRRLVIDLNRLIQREQIRYNRPSFIKMGFGIRKNGSLIESEKFWTGIVELIQAYSQRIIGKISRDWPNYGDNTEFLSSYLPERLSVFKHLFFDRISLAQEILYFSKTKPELLLNRLESEFYKDQLDHREKQFRDRLYDRTVHPTQIYSLEVERIFNKLIDRYIYADIRDDKVVRSAALALVNEYYGNNVALDSIQEGFEILCDLKTVNESEHLTEMAETKRFQPFLSYWGDWDGSTRPSGQGHRLDWPEAPGC